MPSTVRFLRELLVSDREAVIREDIAVRRGDRDLTASLYRLARTSQRPGPLPVWVALHGLTRRGRDHASLVRLARALAASGTAVLIPEIPEWRALRIAPEATGKTLRSAVGAIEARPDLSDRIGVIGFSFGGTHALVSSTDPWLAGRLKAVVSWGGYADLRRTLRFAFVGDHELDGSSYHLEPDPYGRWILAGNYLTRVPGYGDAGGAAEALLDLAREVGRRKLMAWDPATDPIKAEVRTELDDRGRKLFDLIAPRADSPLTSKSRDQLAQLAGALAAVAEQPLDPGDALPSVRVPVFLAHGRDDRLIPWTELVRLRRALPDEVIEHSVITGLFAHSFRERRLPTPATVLDAVRLVRGISRMVRLV